MTHNTLTSRRRRVWSHIMDCVRKYVMDCSSEEQRTKFNEAVSNSIDSVHAICSSERETMDFYRTAAVHYDILMVGPPQTMKPEFIFAQTEEDLSNPRCPPPMDPSHDNISGNEVACRLAKEGSVNQTVTDSS
ncbi:uncharacterized protein TNIN_327221 [Trichonephila inaurata madagascariensis]|uniref:Uncharacterized protein n=1 Tax=Trichonephila inaurata madagascariensis TaxID=2747483 RepID=A0A8X7C0G2_9ARAC|nr:uncharacterized protein TNIN_327221 [Trichonephila inaurata madagascariensis]